MKHSEGRLHLIKGTKNMIVNHLFKWGKEVEPEPVPY